MDEADKKRSYTKAKKNLYSHSKEYKRDSLYEEDNFLVVVGAFKIRRSLPLAQKEQYISCSRRDRGFSTNLNDV